MKNIKRREPFSSAERISQQANLKNKQAIADYFNKDISGVSNGHTTSANDFTKFDPKTEENPSAKEKVNAWIKNLPYWKIEEGPWVTSCFPGIVTSESIDYDEMDCCDADDIQELQSRKITRYVIELYYSDAEIIKYGFNEDELVLLGENQKHSNEKFFEWKN